MKRRLLITALFLLAGAAGCVVAAWSSALLFSPKTIRVQYYDGTSTVVRHLPAKIEHGWPFHSLTSEVPLGDGYVEITAIEVGDKVLPILGLNSFDPGALVSLTLTGTLNDGTAFEVDDCIRLVPLGTPPGLLSTRCSGPT